MTANHRISRRTDRREKRKSWSDHYPDKLRRIHYVDPETGKSLTFLTNNFELPPLTIARFYKGRWKVELFFKWIKQHLRIKHFYGTSDNAVRTQIWISISGLRVGGHREKAVPLAPKPLQHFADFERQCLFMRAPPSSA